MHIHYTAIPIAVVQLNIQVHVVNSINVQGDVVRMEFARFHKQRGFRVVNVILAMREPNVNEELMRVNHFALMEEVAHMLKI